VVNPAFGREDKGIALLARREVDCVLGRDISSPLERAAKALGSESLTGKLYSELTCGQKRIYSKKQAGSSCGSTGRILAVQVKTRGGSPGKFHM